MRYPLEDRYRPGMTFAIGLGAAGAAAIAIALATGRFDDETDPTAADGRAPGDVSAQQAPGGDGGADSQASVHELVAVAGGSSVVILDAPNGERLGTVGETTVFGNPTVLSVAERRGPWLGVESEFAGNDPLAWVQSAPARLSEETTPYSLGIDLLAKELELRRGKNVEETMPVEVGASAADLQAGRFAVSDRVEDGLSPALGPGALALTAVSAGLSPDWPFGDRLAIHGGTGGETAGLRMSNAGMQALLDAVPIGAPVFLVR